MNSNLSCEKCAHVQHILMTRGCGYITTRSRMIVRVDDSLSMFDRHLLLNGVKIGHINADDSFTPSSMMECQVKCCATFLEVTKDKHLCHFTEDIKEPGV